MEEGHESPQTWLRMRAFENMTNVVPPAGSDYAFTSSRNANSMS